ncbi:MAG: hypothetical protein CVT49_13545 [candidate division Zixibacteria bacterium HGW-Zixibacteria-1]|nr:MAG: hypothetical protein CVT49_13545 [candidate division Zixibacteria bacterium HGW-Zixibacteria-1]
MAKSKKQLKALATVIFDLFQPATDKTVPIEVFPEPAGTDLKTAVTLPPVSLLDSMYDDFNREYFGGKLPKATISYSGRMLTAGSYTPGRNEIKIGRKYHEIFPEEIADTLKHEMIHVINQSHDRRFKAMADKIGASVKAKAHPALRGNCKYMYICPECGREYPRRKRLRMASCGICTKGRRYDENFKLRLAKSKKV